MVSSFSFRVDATLDACQIERSWIRIALLVSRAVDGRIKSEIGSIHSDYNPWLIRFVTGRDGERNGRYFCLEPIKADKTEPDHVPIKQLQAT